jgi:hypothetical protein
MLAWEAGCVARWPVHPDQASIVTEDLPRFWEAVDAGASAQDFQTYYLDPGSPGLHALRRARWGRAEALAAAFAEHQAWYRAGRDRSLALSAADAPWRHAVAAVYQNAERAWPDATFPPVTLAFGDFNTGGTQTGRGLVIGVEFYLDGDGAPRDGLGAWHRAVVRTPDELPAIVAHEHAHALQAQVCTQGRSTLLEKALQEGVADFVAREHAGYTNNDHLEVWARPREAALWAEFVAVKDDQDYAGWLFGGGSTPDRPADLGYWVGEQIAGAWWQQHGHRSDAWDTLLSAHCDADAFLRESGYSGSGG